LDVQILYEDKAVGTRARQAFDAVAERFQGQGDLRVTLWRWDMLQEPGLRAAASRYAATADILFLAMHGWSTLPEAVSSWVIEWLAGRTDAPPALVVSLDDQARDSLAAQNLVASLTHLARQAGADLIAHYGPSAESDDPWSINRLNFRAELMTSVLGEALRRTQSYSLRSCGIRD
jgi:hypothetical protein